MPHQLVARLTNSKLPMLVALSLYGVSLFLPAFECSRPQDSPPGWGVLLIGWAGFMTLDVRWLANPLFLVMMLKVALGIRPPTGFLPMPVIASVLAIGSAIFTAQGPCTEMSRSLSLGWGGYLWVAAILVGSLAYGARAQTSQQQAPA
jgi:hypothetical protein